MQKENVKCIYCNSQNIAKKGLRKNKQQTIQKYQCKDCKKYFTIKDVKNKTYTLNIILKAISTYNLGSTLERTREIINKRYDLTITTPTILGWVNEYKNICTFARLRKEAIKLYTPKNIIHKQRLNHIQPYTFKYHKAKLNILLKENLQFTAIKNYLQKISLKEFPNHIFTYNKENKTNEQRASQIKFNHLKIETKDKSNFANQLARLALQISKSNKDRHNAIQNFMLINDSTTIAIEIPVYLTNWDAGYYRNQKGFTFPLNNYTTPITGHIDILQIRNGLIHILDYKPETKNQNPIEQLTIYAMALSRKLNLPLYYFKCAWFDENNYYEFFSLHSVYKKNSL